MKKKIKPAGIFWTKPHSTAPLFLADLQKEIFESRKLKDAAKIVDNLSSDTRQKIILALANKTYLCVGDLSDVLRLDISAVSHQLSVLRKMGWLERKKKGKVVYYSLSESLPKLIQVFVSEIGLG